MKQNLTKEVKIITFEDATLRFKNFRGAEKKFNAAGTRNFNVVVEPEMAQELIELGFNVKEYTAEEGDSPEYMLKVNVSYKFRGPNVTLISSSGKTMLDEDTIEILDSSFIEKVDFNVNVSQYSNAQGDGYSLYLRNMYVSIEEDDLQQKYANVDTSEEFLNMGHEF